MRLIWIVLLAVIGLAPRVPAQSCPPSRIALVLSGGGAKGLAHIGVLRALDSLGIRPDILVGTSMGAIIGGLYASGYSAREIDSLARGLPLTRLFRTYAPRVPRSLGHLQPIVVWEQENGGGLVFQRAAVLEPEVNALLNAGLLRGNLLARGNFDSLPISFRAVATDLLSGDPVVFQSGDLARAVRASGAIPLLFEPERIDGRFVGDGGLSANVPVAVARHAGADRVIVSYTTERRPDSLNLESVLVLIDHLIGNLFRQSPDSLAPADIAIRPNVDGFQSLNFSTDAVSELVARGFDAAIDQLLSSACLPRGERQIPVKPAFRLAGISFQGPAARDSVQVRHLLGLEVGDSVNVQKLQRTLHNLGTSNKYTTIWLHPTGSGDSVVFHPFPRRAPSRVVAIGAVYDNDLGARVWFGQVDRDFLRDDIELSSAALFGELEQQLYSALRLTSGGGTFAPSIELGLSRELIRRFSDGDEEAPFKIHEGVGFAGLEANWPAGWQGALGLEGRLWDEPGRRSRSALGPRVTVRRVGPVAETLFEFQAVATGQYRRVEIEGIATVTLGRLKIRPHGRFGHGRALPPQLGFILGGSDGFAGRHIGELRSSRELSGGLIFLYPVFGKVLLRVEPMLGSASQEGNVFPRGETLWGGRVGLNLSTGLGPIRVEYGFSEGGRDGLLVRLGRWF